MDPLYNQPRGIEKCEPASVSGGRCAIALRTSGELCSNLSASPFLSRLGEAD